MHTTDLKPAAGLKPAAELKPAASLKQADRFTPPPFWRGKPYYSLDAWCKNTFGEKCYKIALDAGFTCPNRDGTIGTGGCIFCSAGGSGDFSVATDGSDLSRQLQKGLELFHEKRTGNRFIAYFQAYTNTYGPVEKLRMLYEAALKEPAVCGISIATRPDCVGEEVCALLQELKAAYPQKFIWIELGLQTIHETTARFLNRGYALPCFEEAFSRLKRAGIPVIVHVILGLPGETTKQIYETIHYLNRLSPFGIKLQLLHILKGTALADIYERTPFPVYTLEEYLDVLTGCVERLSPSITIHRLTGDGPRDLVIAPRFSLNKRLVLNSFHAAMKQRHTYQGRCYYDPGSPDPV